MPSMGTRCTLVVGDFARGIKLFEIENCEDQPNYVSSMPSDVIESTSSGNKIGVIVGASIGAILAIGLVAIVIIIVARRRNSSNESTDIELASPMLRDIEVLESIGRGNFGGM